MAEFCRKCFIDTWKPNKYDIDHIIMSEDWDICEGCGNIGPYVDHIGLDEELYSKKYKQMLQENSENTGLNIFNIMTERKNKKTTVFEVINLLEKLKKQNGNQKIILETPDGTVSVCLKDALIYEGCRGEIVLDSE